MPVGSLMRSISRLGFHLARLALLLLVAFPLAAPVARGADEAPKNYLTFKVGLTGSAVSTTDWTGRTTTVEFADQFSGMIEVRAERDAAGGITWYPRGSTLKLDGQVSQTWKSRTVLKGEGEASAVETVVETYTGAIVCDADFGNAFVKLRPADKRYDLQFGLMADMATTQEAVRYSRVLHVSGDPSVGGGRHEESSHVVPLDTGPAQNNVPIGYYDLPVAVKDVALAGPADVLTGTARIPVAKPSGWDGAWDVAVAVSWRVGTALPPVELAVTVGGYAQWRPEGSIKKPAEPGNHLVARATLKTKGSKAEFLPAVKSIRFELLDTSREPGVCLNWPLNAKDTDYDLRLAVVAGGTLSKSDQLLEVTAPPKDDNGRPYAETRIDSYDFGGRASLRAVCTLEDGSEIEGAMKGEGGGQNLVLLPRRFSGDWIAKKWREDRQVIELSARADDDNAPVGDGTLGDGLTLYEEYRGWVEDGKHIEGDPKTKDFFIQLKKAGVALLGIAKFQRLTGLNVHYNFTEKEFPASRIINANRDRGPHVTDQHGVIVQIKKMQPGVSRAVGGPGNPKMITSVDLMSDVASFGANYVAITVAHELGHCVNLWHHGDVDQKVIWAVVGGKLYEGRSDGTVSGEIFVVNEELDDITPVIIDQALEIQAQPAPANRLKVQMGRDQGQHSGSDNCIMRYDDSQTFVYRARPDFRFGDFSEPVGNELCTTAEGSGVNDKDRDTKQPRYGPALSGRGDCIHQILVTDADTAPWRHKIPRKP